MQVVLAVTGCGPRLEVALAAPTLATPSLVALSGSAPRSDVILAAIDLLLRSSGIAASELQLVVATRGPGSFTGIRVALATAQGFALAAGIPGHGISSLVVQAMRTAQRPCLAVQPARRGFVYAQRFDDPAQPDRPAAAPAVAGVGDLLAAGAPVIAPAGLDLPAGVPLATTERSAAEALLTLAARLSEADSETLTPLYAEAPQAVPARASSPPWQPSPKAS